MGIAQVVAPRGTRRRKWAKALVQAARTAMGSDGLQEERNSLKRSWAKHDPNALDQYLVTGYQNPRVNAQSMLTRHYLIRQLFGDQFDALMREELEHCVKATEALRTRAAELGVKMGTFLNPEKRAGVEEVSEVIADWEDAYEERWAAALSGRTAGPLKVLEFACGSANDFRFFDSYGIAEHLDYTGVDLNDGNIDNARQRFPGVNFEVQSVLDLPYDDDSFDHVVASDIFEHLSPEAMEQSVGEACRLARKGLIFTFFSMSDEPEHEVRPVRNYHWNVLSAPRMAELIEKQFGPVEVIKIRDFMTNEYGYKRSYNKKAWTMIAKPAP
ncbi:MAG: methyltransferase domain-containing protein [Micromonosporaceae bacterium]|nr:methyltransferase domain-containing protein [Micromonosporaceae bacterium]